LSQTLRRYTVALIASAALMALAASSAQAAPTGVDFTVDPATPQSGVAATLTATATAPPLFEITTIEWDLDGNGTFDATGSPLPHTFPTAGTYQVTVRVTTNELLDNQASTTKAVTVATRPPTAAFGFNPASPSVGENVLFASNSTDPDNDTLAHSWNFGDGSGPSTARNPTHAYATPGTKTVRLTVNDGKGGVDDQTHQIVVRDPSAATASFTTSPDAPVQGQPVAFTSTSTPSSGQSITALDWDLDSDGQYDDARGRNATRVFDSPGVYRVALRVRQANGNTSIAEGTVRVGGLPVPTPPGVTPPGDLTPPTAPPTIGGLRLLTPFPVVRLRGLAYPRRTVVTLLAVRAPRGALARVSCDGRGCPKAVRRKRSRGRVLRFKTFERSIPAGARLEVFVVRSKRIGKYTRFKLRSSNFPLRADACVMPGKSKPRPCPS
jgi:PKD repeat protein